MPRGILAVLLLLLTGACKESRPPGRIRPKSKTPIQHVRVPRPSAVGQTAVAGPVEFELVKVEGGCDHTPRITNDPATVAQKHTHFSFLVRIRHRGDQSVRIHLTHVYYSEQRDAQGSIEDAEAPEIAFTIDPGDDVTREFRGKLVCEPTQTHDQPVHVMLIFRTSHGTAIIRRIAGPIRTVG